MAGSTRKVHEVTDALRETVDRGLVSAVVAPFVRGDDLQSTLDSCVHEIAVRIGGDLAGVWLLDDDEESLGLRARAGAIADVGAHHLHVPVGHYKIGMIADRAVAAPHQRRAARRADQRRGVGPARGRGRVRRLPAHDRRPADRRAGDVLAVSARPARTRRRSSPSPTSSRSASTASARRSSWRSRARWSRRCTRSARRSRPSSSSTASCSWSPIRRPR